VLAVGVDLGRAVVAAGAGDDERLRALAWPPVGVVRAHLPVPWILELASAATAVGNPPPRELVDRVMPDPGPVVHVSVLGPLRVERDGTEVEAPELRRRRVRELLCTLVAEPRQRRAALAEQLWPDVADPAANLRVNLTHLQHLLEPERAKRAVPAFLRSEGAWLSLVRSSRLVVDAWELDTDLEEAARADGSGDVARGLEAYLRAIARWRGEPFADVDDAPWVHPAREVLRRRHLAAALRAGELLLAGGAPARARDAADRALAADPHSTAAHHLLVRAHLADGDVPGARRAVVRCEDALAQIEVPPDAAVRALLR
jgi:LuxR family transcriptional regulator, maltose regulon positive regulatory protein